MVAVVIIHRRWGKIDGDSVRNHTKKSRPKQAATQPADGPTLDKPADLRYKGLSHRGAAFISKEDQMCHAIQECEGTESYCSTQELDITFADAAVTVEVRGYRCLTCRCFWTTKEEGIAAELAAVKTLTSLGTQDPAAFTAFKKFFGFSAADMAEIFHTSQDAVSLYVRYGVVQPEWWGTLAIQAMMTRLGDSQAKLPSCCGRLRRTSNFLAS